MLIFAYKRVTMDFSKRQKDNFSARFIKWVIRRFKRRPKVINLNGDELPPGGSILIAQHSAASGPMTYRTFLAPPPMMIWGAHPMCEGYRARRRYLIDIFYGQKLGFGKFRAWICGTLFAIVSRWIYDSAGVIPVYYDNRAKQTFSNSIKCLKEKISLLIFPENSTGGYNEVINESFHAGYITLAKLAFKFSGTDTPVYCMNYSKKCNCVVIGKPLYVNEMLKTMHKDEVNEYFRTYMNGLAEHIPERA